MEAVKDATREGGWAYLLIGEDAQEAFYRLLPIAKSEGSNQSLRFLKDHHKTLLFNFQEELSNEQIATVLYKAVKDRSHSFPTENDLNQNNRSGTPSAPKFDSASQPMTMPKKEVNESLTKAKEPLNIDQSSLKTMIGNLMADKMDQQNNDCVPLTIAIYNELSNHAHDETRTSSSFDFTQEVLDHRPIVKTEEATEEPRPKRRRTSHYSHVLTSASVKNLESILQSNLEVLVDLTDATPQSSSVYDLSNEKAAHYQVSKTQLKERADKLSDEHNTNVMVLTIGAASNSQRQLQSRSGHMMLLVNVKPTSEPVAEWLVLDPQQRRFDASLKNVVMTLKQFEEVYNNQVNSPFATLLPAYGILVN